MSDFENDFQNEEVAVAQQPTTEAAIEAAEEERQAEVATVEAPAAVVEAEFHLDTVEDEDDEPEDDDFFDEEEVPAVPEIDPATVVTIRTSASGDKYVQATSAMPLIDVISKSGLRFNGDFTCWLNGQEVALGTQVAGGMTVTVVGSVKGGAEQ